jgi:hypothetical protein
MIILCVILAIAFVEIVYIVGVYAGEHDTCSEIIGQRKPYVPRETLEKLARRHNMNLVDILAYDPVTLNRLLYIMDWEEKYNAMPDMMPVSVAGFAKVIDDMRKKEEEDGK